MHRIDGPFTVSALPAAEPAAGSPGYFDGGDPLNGRKATRVTPRWLNMIQEELMAVILAAGLKPDRENHGQLKEAIGKTLDAGLAGRVPRTLKIIVKGPLNGGGTLEKDIEIGVDLATEKAAGVAPLATEALARAGLDHQAIITSKLLKLVLNLALANLATKEDVIDAAIHAADAEDGLAAEIIKLTDRVTHLELDKVRRQA